MNDDDKPTNLAVKLRPLSGPGASQKRLFRRVLWSLRHNWLVITLDPDSDSPRRVHFPVGRIEEIQEGDVEDLT